MLGGGEAQDGSVATVSGGTDVQIKSGFANYVYGGGADWDTANRSSDVSVDSAKVSISGGSSVQSNVYAGGYAADSNSASEIGGSATVKISNATLNGDIYAGGYGSGSSINGDATIVFTGSGDELSFGGTVYGSGANGAVVNGSTVLAFGDDTQAFKGTFNGKISGIDLIVISEQSEVDFAGAFGVDTLMVSSEALIALAADTSFEKFSLVFADDFVEGDTIDIGEIFKDSESESIVMSAIESGGKTFTVFGGDQEWTTVYENGEFVVSAAVPEPAAFAAVLAAFALGASLIRGRK